MSACLVCQGLEEALWGEKNLPLNISKKEKKDVLDKAYSALILSLGNQVLREVSKEKTVAAVWLKLENLYMTKILHVEDEKKKRKDKTRFKQYTQLS